KSSLILFCKDSANKWNDKNACEKIAIFAQKKHTKKAQKKATGSDCDSRFPVASIIFSDVLESR
ncbi:MAG: hypothetical protein SPG67_10520, partial [Sodaliphilus sp.]|nr:hypothetical protein [Sodaliphilus sp.]